MRDGEGLACGLFMEASPSPFAHSLSTPTSCLDSFSQSSRFSSFVDKIGLDLSSADKCCLLAFTSPEEVGLAPCDEFSDTCDFIYSTVVQV